MLYQLFPVWEEFRDHMEVYLIPFGNAFVSLNENNNLYHNTTLELFKNIEYYFQIIYVPKFIETVILLIKVWD